MKKVWISVLAGLFLGLVISYAVLDYQEWTLIYIGRSGETDNAVKELDFDFITHAFGIVLVSTGVVYGVLTLISKSRKVND